MGLLGYIMCKSDSDLAPNNPNLTKGMHWVRQAAEAGDQNAIFHLRKLEGEAKGSEH